jgi:hypothetical protein
MGSRPSFACQLAYAAASPAVVSVNVSSSTISQPFGCLREFVEGQSPADAATLAIHYDVQQPASELRRRLLRRTFSTNPRSIDFLLLDMFSHHRWITVRIGSDQ